MRLKLQILFLSCPYFVKEILLIILLLNLNFVVKAQLSSTHKILKINQYRLYNEALEATPDSCFLISGYEDGGSHGQALSKFDSFGNILWCKTYFSVYTERVPQIYQTDWNDYLLATITPALSYVLRSIDYTGNAKW